MNRLRLILFFGYFASLGLTPNAFGQKEIPELWGQRVHDEAHVLSQQTIGMLEQELKRFEDSTSNQIAVLIVPSLDGDVIEQYGLRVAEKWKLGQADKDNGAVLLVAINDRKMRIEVGQGLEGPLPDAICNRIIRNEMVPNFRRGDYDAGVLASVEAMMRAVKGEYKADPRSARRNGGKLPLMVVILLVFLLFRFISRNRGGGSAWSAGAGWMIGSALGGMGRGGGGGGGFSGGGGSFGGGGSSGSW